MKRYLAVSLGLAVFLCADLAAQATGRRLLSLDDLASFKEVADPRVSPDGKWVAYTVESVDAATDEKRSALWMVSWDGSQRIQLTQGADSASAPRWSPDGRFLSFLTSRSEESERTRSRKTESAQVWLLDRRGGEARQLTDIKGDISDYAWSPDGKRLALVARKEKQPEVPRKAAVEEPPPEPIVIDRYFFKNDADGYASAAERRRIYLYEIESKMLAALTPEVTFDESDPAWSPDGSRIAFVSNRDGAEWDRTENTEVHVATATPGSPPRRLTAFAGSDTGPLAWSADGREIAYVQGSEPKYSIYGPRQLAVVPVNGGAPRLLATALDRDVSDPQFSAAGRSIDFLMEDDRSAYSARVASTGGAVKRLTETGRVVSAHSRAAGRIAVLTATDETPPEIYAHEAGALRKLTGHNDAWLAQVRLAATQEISFSNKDGTEVHGLVTKPPLYESGKKYPALLWMHGGPYGQDSHEFDFERQLFAANGYAVIQVNYRGSSGRGASYGRSIFADWGNKEVVDVLAAVDYVIDQGIADPERLGVGGWSYGGFLTDYVIASDTRFKAAISGAGAGSQLSLYGSDQYVFAYDQEFEPPWRSPDLWIKLSYPFFHADRIRTPTLFLGGDRDFNVPIIGGEQMYQALKTLKVPTQLIIYPGEKHLLVRPSFVRDCLQRYLDWFARYLQPASVTAVTPKPPVPRGQ